MAHGVMINFELGFELEFYLDSTLSDSDLEQISKKLHPARLVKERGRLQYELITPPYPFIDIADLITKYSSHLSDMKLLFAEIAPNIKIDFHPKPNKNDYGSALQISISSRDLDRSGYLNFIYCLLDRSLDFNTVINKRSGKIRLDERFMAPTHVAWGGNNNRTVLVRALNLDQDDLSEVRIEYRLANSDADPKVLAEFVVDCLQNSIKNNFAKLPKTWGNAYDKQYDNMGLSDAN